MKILKIYDDGHLTDIYYEENGVIKSWLRPEGNDCLKQDVRKHETMERIAASIDRASRESCVLYEGDLSDLNKFRANKEGKKRYVEVFENEADSNGEIKQFLVDRIYEGEDGKLHYQEWNEKDEDLAETGYTLEDILKYFNNGYTCTSEIKEGDMPGIEG